MSRSSKSRFLLALALVLGGSAVGSPVASAETSMPTLTITAPNGVLYDECEDHHFFYSVTPPTSDWWSLDITVDGPTDSWDVAVNSLWGDPASGAESIFACGGMDTPGRYSVVGVLSDSDGNVQGQVSTSFRMRAHKTRTALKVSRRSLPFNSPITMTVTSKQEAKNGWKSNAYNYVRFQTRTLPRGGWMPAAQGRRFLTDDRGKVIETFRFTRRGAHAVRAVTEGGEGGTKSFSAPLVVTGR